jgi:hypothetical protein
MGNNSSSNGESKTSNSRSKASPKLPTETRGKLEDWLKNVPFSLNSSQTQGIFDAVQVLDVDNPKTLIKKGEEAVGIFVVLAGKIEVVSEEQKYVLREVPIGECFGEVSVIYGTECTADVRAATRYILSICECYDTLLKDIRKVITGSLHYIFMIYIFSYKIYFIERPYCC